MQGWGAKYTRRLGLSPTQVWLVSRRGIQVLESMSHCHQRPWYKRKEVRCVPTGPIGGPAICHGRDSAAVDAEAEAAGAEAAGADDAEAEAAEAEAAGAEDAGAPRMAPPSEAATAGAEDAEAEAAGAEEAGAEAARAGTGTT